MEYQVKVSNSAKQKSACLVFGVYESGQLSASAQQFDQAHAGHLSRLLKNSGMNGKLEQDRLLLDIPDSKADRVLLIGCGKADTIDDARYRKILSHTAQALTRTGAKDAVLYLNQLQIKERSESWRIRLASEIISASGYRFTEMKSKPNDENGLPAKITFAVADRKGLAAAQQALREGQAVAAGVALARDLGNLPGNICTPSYLAKQAKILAADYKTIKVKVLREAEMEKLGMGALLSVSKGSDQPARLIQMEYRNAPAKQAPVVLVGKGITFDTGGISIKPAGAMDEMKFDMCGAASVFGTIRACAELELPLNVIGLVAASENMPGGRASKPGDIVKTLSGQTVEILNTDAEGRLVLCDAVSYSERFKPDVVIDIATLTGACVVALGKHPHGLFSNHQALADALLAAGNNTVDRAWQLPLWEDYQEQLDSNFADMANIGGREGGAITAACFLSRFAKNLHWAHLDIAGTAWLSGKQKGATGRPVPLLTQFLLDRAAQE